MIIPGFCVNQRKEKAEHHFADSELGKPADFVLLLLF